MGHTSTMLINKQVFQLGLKVSLSLAESFVWVHKFFHVGLNKAAKPNVGSGGF
jgi:hypothetical protein